MKSILPVELWIEIFSYLTCNDRKAARLVCRTWASIGMSSKFREKMVWMITDNNSTNMWSLLESRLIRSNRLGDWDFPNIKITSCLNGNVVKILTFLKKYVRSLLLCGKNYINLKTFHKLEEIQISLTSENLIAETLDNLCCLQTPLRSIMIKDCLNNGDLVVRPYPWLGIHAANLEVFECEYKIECDTNVLSDFREMHKLRRISLAGINGEHIVDILKSLPIDAPLTEIEITGLFNFGEELAKVIGEKYQNIKYLNLAFCNPVMDILSTVIGTSVDTLTVLNISQCQRLQQEIFLEGLVSKENRMLRELRMSNCCGINENGMIKLTQNLPNLEVLDAGGLKNAVTNQCIGYINLHLNKLRILLLDDCVCVTDNGLIGGEKRPFSISNIKGLKILSLRNVHNLTDRSIVSAFKFSDLRELYLGCQRNITLNALSKLEKNCPNLKKLQVSNNKGSSKFELCEHFSRTERRYLYQGQDSLIK